VVITSQRVARDIGFGRVIEYILWIAAGRQVVHAGADHAQCAGLQLCRVSALVAMLVHPVHVGMMAGIQPRLQAFAGQCQVGIGNADVLEAKFQRPMTDIVGKPLHVHGARIVNIQTLV
jgi:hypothetical protein